MGHVSASQNGRRAADVMDGDERDRVTSRPMVALRPLEPADCGRLVGWIDSEDALYQWSGPWDFGWPLNVRQVVDDLRTAGADRLVLAVVDRGDGELVGHVMLRVQRRHRLGLIARVLVAPERRNEGLGTVMLRELVRHGIEDLGLHRLQLGVYAFNAAAIACYHRVGFVTEGVHRDSALAAEGGYWSTLVMGLISGDESVSDAEPDGASIRRARPRDRAEVARMLTDLGYPHTPPQAGARLIEWMAEPRAVVLVAEVDGRPAGFIAVSEIPYFERPGSLGRIVALAVDTRHRRGGVGRRLVAAAERWAAARGCIAVEVASRRARAGARAFYPALGYHDRCGESGRFIRSLTAVRRGTVD